MNAERLAANRRYAATANSQQPTHMGETDQANPEATAPGATSGNPAESSAGNTHGAAYWRSLEEYADSREFRRHLANEFPDYDPEELQSVSRRQFLKLAGASMALAGLTISGCRRWPREQIAPYAKRALQALDDREGSRPPTDK
jgi:MoCo/4Fe-4S cofactor protein with predicted Tat translocation signal